MGFALVLRELLKRRLLLAIGVVIAGAVATLSIYRFEDGKLKSRSLEYSSASTQVLVDSQSSVLGNVTQSFEPLASRAQVYANFMTNPAVLSLIGQRVGLSGEQIYAAGPVNADEPRVEQEPTALKRNVELTGETKPYRLSFESQASLPTIAIDAQAPSTQQAVALADAAAVGMQEYVAKAEAANKVPAASRIIIRQLGPATGGVVDGGVRKSVAVLSFLGVLLVWCVLLLAVPRARVLWRQSAALEASSLELAPTEPEPENDDQPLRREVQDWQAPAAQARAPGLGGERSVFEAPSRLEQPAAAVPGRSAR